MDLRKEEVRWDGWSGSRRLSSKTLADFNRELGFLVKAGIPLAKALSVIAQEESRSRRERAALEELLLRIRQGALMSEAMESMEPVFPPMMVSMFRVAETAGDLGQAALSLGDYYQKEYRMRENWRAASAYPKLLAAVILSVAVFLVVVVLPQFEDLFDTLEELPLATRMLYGMMDGMKNHWGIILYAVIMAAVSSKILSQMELVRYHLDCLRLKLPVLGLLYRKICTARFAQALSALYSVGTPMLQALGLAGRAVENTYLERELEHAAERLRAGESLGDALGGMDGFIRKLSDSVRIGEASGCLDDMLSAIAEDLDYEAELAGKQLMTLAEPLMIIGMAGLVGFLMAAVLLPVYASYSALEVMAYY